MGLHRLGSNALSIYRWEAVGQGANEGQTTAWAIQRREISRDRVPRDLHAANVSRAKDLVAVISAASLS